MKSLIEKDFEKYLLDENIKYISFDIFDTIVFRKVNSPIDVFQKLTKKNYIKKLFPKNSFTYYRQEAHKSALNKCKIEEVTLVDIYDEISFLSQKQKIKLIKLELEEEKKQIIVNKFMENLLKLSLQKNKKIILISDMYLSTEELNFVALSKLEKEITIGKVYVSSEIKKSKYTGNLFVEVLNELKIEPHEILHIGDNERNDVNIPNKLGIKTIHYKRFEDRIEENYINEFYPNKLNLLRSLSINNNLALDKKDKFFYEFGSNILGPLLWSFCLYILKSSKKLKTKQINFIMREGVIFKKYFSKFLKYLDLDNEYELNIIYASRKSVHLVMMDENDIKIDKSNFLSFRDVSLEKFFKIFNIEILDEELKEYKKHSILELVQEEKFYNKIDADFIHQKNKIKESILDNKKCFKEYLNQCDLQNNSLLIDFGSSGSVNHVINKFILDKKLNHLLLYSSIYAYKKLDFKLDVFLSLNELNRKDSILLRRYAEVFEIILNGLENTTLGYKRNIKIEPIKSNIKFSDEFKSTIDFVEKGIDTFFEMSHKYKFKGATSSFLFKMLSRVLVLPTNEETKYLGELPIELGYDGEKQTTIINDKNRNIINEQGVDRILNEFNFDSESYIKELPWLHGTISNVHKNYFLDRMFNEEINILNLSQRKILFRLDERNIKELSIYGIGELYRVLRDELIEKGIKINYLIDSFTSEQQQKYIDGYLVINLEEAVKKGEKNILITSLTYKNELARKVRCYPSLICLNFT